MALPPLLLSALGAAASNRRVQKGAERLLRDAYGRIDLRRQERQATAETADPLADAIAPLATRDEVAAQFALLQAEIEQRQTVTDAPIARGGLDRAVGDGGRDRAAAALTS